MEDNKQGPKFSYISGFLLLTVVGLLVGDYMFRHGGPESLPRHDSPIVAPIDPLVDAETFVTLASNDGSAAALQSMILIVLCVWLVRILFISFRKRLYQSQPLFVVFRLLLFAWVALLLYSDLVSKGAPILAMGPVVPGSLLTRWFNIDVAIWFRRLLEPSLWFSCGLVLLVAYHSISWSRIGVRYLISAGCLLAYLLTQVFCLFPFFSSLGSVANEFGSYVIYLLGQFSLVALVDTVGQEIRLLKLSERFEKTSPPALFRYYVATGSAVLLVLLSGAISSFSESKANNLKVGAYYYSWFPQNWKAGYAWRSLDPGAGPHLGEYSSIDMDIAKKHIKWAREAGISFFIFDWWPNRREVRRNLYRMQSHDDLLKDFQFAMHYESLDIDDPSDPSPRPEAVLGQEDSNIIFITPKRMERLKLHWEQIAKFYMTHPSYLRIDGKPVLFVYATRHLVGGLQLAVREARAHVKEKTGLELFLVADEAFFNVMDLDLEDHTVGPHLLGENQPNWDRLLAFDAITSYNPYDSTRTAHAGAAGVELFLDDVERTYRAYRRIAATGGLRFIPSVIPGYNDRGVRPKEDHYVIPRTIDLDSKEESLLTASLRRFGFPFVDRELGLLTITSWNEWNEGTQIEPTIDGPCTTRDNSESQQAITQGIEHCGYGMGHLEELKAEIDELRN